MCGRTAWCSNDYKKATTYFNDETGKYEQVGLVERKNCNLQFRQSTNLAPTEALPVIISSSHDGHYDGSSETCAHILQPMIWSLIPSWHKGEYNKHGLSTNNARLEGISTSKLYSKALKKGQRCVVVSDGFYEWKKNSGTKQPYFVYAKQNDDIRVEDTKCWDSAIWSEDKGWNGPKVLKMAGVFDIWTSCEGLVVPSCSIITMESNKHFSWIHERMPAILDTDDAVKEWLDYEGTPLDDALSLLKQSESIQWHPVTSKMGNSRYKEADSCQPINLNKRPSEKGGALMSWLKTGSISSNNKKHKTE